MSAAHYTLLLAVPMISVVASVQAAEPIDVGSRKQLFIDRKFIEHSEGVRLTMNPPRKTGERNIVPDKPWENHRVGGYTTVMEDEGVYKMYYDAISTDGSRWLCLATSTDGIHWEKPNIGIVEYQGSTQNNIIWPPQRAPHEPNCVFKDTNPNCPPDQRYKMLCSYQSPGKPNGTWVAVSGDGIHFRLLSDKPSFRPSDTGNIAFWDGRINRYVAFVRMWDPMRKVGRCEFDDPADFGPARTVFGYDEYDPPDMDFYTNACIKYPYADDAYFIFPSAYFHYPEPPAGKYRNDGPVDIRLAVSRDGIGWHRVDRRPFIPLGVQGSFDDSAMYMILGFIRKDPEIWMYYAGYDFTHGAYSIADDKNKGAISRVVLRTDGWVSADAGYSGGSFTTPLITFTGGRLELNIETGVAGSAKVEVIGADGLPVPGFTLDDCDPIRLSWIDKTVTWKGKPDVSALAGQPIRLRFVMRGAKLYAFQFIEE